LLVEIISGRDEQQTAQRRDAALNLLKNTFLIILFYFSCYLFCCRDHLISADHLCLHLCPEIISVLAEMMWRHFCPEIISVAEKEQRKKKQSINS
jgi:hypothetical protein